ncbi:MAG: hypothetical protein LBJ15_00065 [Comamonas sp.]|jgi:hypothetical protein|uniref:hypothetical protein n=1 Tax=Comamonas sp. TaxID=34028 RepID=UPI0028235AD4|nr:hypothetical protein [Comamonas sp.]MDR0212380.1 hypothetical protein [Comamonas sp.]
MLHQAMLTVEERDRLKTRSCRLTSSWLDVTNCKLHNGNKNTPASRGVIMPLAVLSYRQ